MKTMNTEKLKYSFLLTIFITCNLSAQKPIVSPRDSVTVEFTGSKISINYGKPSMLGRKIFGGFVPYYKIWRTGAGAATVLNTEVDMEIDGAIVPRGTYSIFTLPTEERWKLIINKQTGQWGTDYNSQLDLARIDMAVNKLKKPIEELSVKLEKIDNTNGILKIEWEKTSVSVQFHVSKEPLVPSPRDSSEIILDGKRIVIDYGRPSMRGRKIMGSVVPYGKIWRTGANAATRLSTQSDLTINGIKIPQGVYSIYTLPTSKQWKLIINKQTGQWGNIYNEKLDLARIQLRKNILKDPVEKFTIKLEKKNERSGIMKLEWEKTQLSIPFKII